MRNIPSQRLKPVHFWANDAYCHFGREFDTLVIAVALNQVFYSRSMKVEAGKPMCFGRLSEPVALGKGGIRVAGHGGDCSRERKSPKNKAVWRSTRWREVS